MSIYKTITVFALAAAPAVVHAQAMSAATYVMKAGASDLYEKQSSQLELQSTNPKIRDFAQEMIKDHSQSTAQVKAAAMAANMHPAPPKLDAKQAHDVAALKAASGKARDSLYLSQQKMAHQQALMLHKNYAANGTVPSLKTAAEKIVPVIQHHISELQSM